MIRASFKITRAPLPLADEPVEQPEQPGIEMSTEARLAFRRYAEMTHGDLSDAPRMAQYLFNAGYREAIAAMVKFQGLSERIGRIERDAHELRLLVERLEQ